MTDSENGAGETRLFWFNMIGITIVAVSLGTFFFLYGDRLLALMLLLFGPPQPGLDWH